MRPRAAPLILLVVLAAACADEVTEPPATATSTVPTTTAPATTTTATPSGPTLPPTEADLPPHELAPLAALFDPLVAPLGYRVGRAALIDRRTYEETPEGRHLALYLTPLAAKTPDEYASDFLPMAKTFVPAVFAHWPGLESFDVCQEPFDFAGDTAPPGLTIFDITREAADQIDWESVDLAGLLQANLEGLDIYAQESIRSSAVWVAAGGTWGAASRQLQSPHAAGDRPPVRRDPSVAGER